MTMYSQEPQAPRRVNRAKARLQRRAEGMEAQRQEALREAAGMTDFRSQEAESMRAKLSSFGLCAHPVRPDGHCLYTAFAHQLKLLGRGNFSYEDLRHQAAEYLRSHEGDFQPFLLTADGQVTADLASYANELECTAKWGGELEIIALARRNEVAVEVIQSSGATLQYESNHAGIVRLARYSHMYSLGAHYDSVVAQERDH
ncbi:OTU protein [Savitreella phatthalungensis]